MCQRSDGGITGQEERGAWVREEIAMYRLRFGGSKPQHFAETCTEVAKVFF
jgi:hypothetical protein